MTGDDALPGALAAAAGQGALVVMTCNVRTAAAPDPFHPWVRRRDALAAVVEEVAPDACGFQEPGRSQLSWLRERLEGYEVAAEGRRGGGKGEQGALFVRRPRLELVDAEARWYSETPEVGGSRSWGNHFPRFALLCRVVDAATGRELLVVVTHLDHASGRSRAASAEALASWLDAAGTRSWVVLGDFNTTPDDDALVPLWDVGLRDVLGSLPPKGRGAGTFHAFRGGDRGPRIDHVLVSADWEVATAGIVRRRPGGRLPSDHWPVVAALR